MDPINSFIFGLKLMFILIKIFFNIPNCPAFKKTHLYFDLLHLFKDIIFILLSIFLNLLIPVLEN